MESANKMNAGSEATWQVWFSSQRLSEKPSKFNLSGDASAGYAWKASSGSGQVFPIMYLIRINIDRFYMDKYGFVIWDTT